MKQAYQYKRVTEITLPTKKNVAMVASKVSCDDFLMLMPHQNLHKVVGYPTYSQMKKWRKQMSANLIAV